MTELLQLLERLLNTPLLTIGDATLRLKAPLVFVLSMAMSWWLASWLDKQVRRQLEKAEETDERSFAMSRRLIYWPAMIVGLLFAVRNSGADPELLHNVVNLRLFSISATPVTLFSLWLFAVLLFFSSLVSRLGQKGLERAFVLRGFNERGTISATKRLLHYVIMALGTGVALETVGIDLSVLFAAGAVFAVGFGFAMQNIAENFVSGIILLVERAIKPGDVLEMEGEDVVVKRMAIRSTVVRTRDDEELIVPNATFVTSVVRNHTYLDTYCRVRAQIGVSYKSDMRKVEEVLRATALAMPDRTEDREPVIYLLGFGASSVDWEVSIWTTAPWEKPRLRSDLNKAIWFALKDAGIEIPFPQMDVHLIPQPSSPSPEPGARRPER